MQIPYSTIRYCAQRLQNSSNETDRFSALDVLNWLDWMKAQELPKRAPVAPKPGQVWQKLNTGNKTASSAPRIRITQVDGSTVCYQGALGGIRTMRITTLQRDWYCFNPEGA